MDAAQPPPAQQQDVAPSLPVASDPSKPEAPRGPALPPAPAGLGYLATLGVGVGFLQLGASGFSESIRYAGRLTAHSQAFVRFGAETLTFRARRATRRARAR